MVNWGRILRHLLASPLGVRRAFPATALAAIEAAVRAGETKHLGEVRFAVEAELGLGALLRGESARERAVEVFSTMRVWDTAENSGVLIYLLLADRDVEIVADRGIAARVPQAQWEAICQAMEAHFRAGRFETGVVEGVRAVSDLLATHFPAAGPNPDELPDKPAVLQ